MPSTCYMCAQLATSKEHVPPRCLFPEQKDTAGIDYRKGLLTVPSCDDHNSRKSADDEYLMMALTGYFQNNQVAQQQIRSKITRAWILKPSVAQDLVKNPVLIQLGNTQHLAFDVDKKFNQSLAWIANGIHLLETGNKATPQYKVIAYPLFQHGHEHARDVNVGRLNILLMAAQLFVNTIKKGNNSDVFWYQIIADADGGGTTVRMCFFEAFIVIARSSPCLEDHADE